MLNKLEIIGKRELNLSRQIAAVWIAAITVLALLAAWGV
jgi:hypothetical protein